jgi:outer membrane immunogenic protein
MKNLLLASVGIAVLALSGAASAADLSRAAPVYKGAAPAVSVYNWTGCYVGGNIGGMWVKKDWSVQQVGNFAFGRPDGSDNPSGFMGGGQIGCDYQFAGGFVVGVAGDYDWTNASATHISPNFAGYTDSSKVDSLASVTGRVGYAWDRFLGYVKGGGAWERDVLSYTGPTTASLSQTRSGWTVGVGGEYAFTNFLSGFAEFDYYDFGDRNVVLVDNRTGPFTYGIKETKGVVKAGLNFRWGGAGPVVARY